jgi:hypothetical protein
MRGLNVRGLLALIAVFCLLQLQVAPIAAQGMGGLKGDEEGTPEVELVSLEEAGLISDTEYESPQFGYGVEWTEDWVLDDYFDNPDEGLQPVMTDPENEQDRLYLIWTEGSSDYGYIYIIGQTASRGGPDLDVEEWSDADYIDSQWPADEGWEAEVLLAEEGRDRGSVVYSLISEEGVQYYTIYLSIELDGGEMIYITFSTDENSFEDAFEHVSEDIEIDGDPIFTLYDWDDIEAEL